MCAHGEGELNSLVNGASFTCAHLGELQASAVEVEQCAIVGEAAASCTLRVKWQSPLGLDGAPAGSRVMPEAVALTVRLGSGSCREH